MKSQKNANCVKGKVGAIIVLNGEILGKGNNSVPKGCIPCIVDTCLRKKYNLKSGEKQELCRVVHAEQNAILNSLRKGYNLNNSTIYVTKSPCMICAKLIINVGIKKVIYAISGRTAAELIYERANSEKEHMRLTNWLVCPL